MSGARRQIHQCWGCPFARLGVPLRELPGVSSDACAGVLASVVVLDFQEANDWPPFR